jgi:hypothetical protein
MMSTFSLYDEQTGLFIGVVAECVPTGIGDMLISHPHCSFVMGEFDALSQRVDLATGEVVAYQPPAPSEHHAWNAGTKRWDYIKPAALVLDDAKADAQRQANQLCAARLSAIRDSYPVDEVTSWSKQETEARAWTVDNAAPTPLLTAIAEARGVPFALLVEKVIEKSDLFATVSGQLIGARQQAEDRIGAAATPADVEAIISQLFPPS